MPITELEMMSPEERRTLHAERTITDLSQADPASLERVQTQLTEALAKRAAVDARK